jgi:glutaredoxin 3
MAESFFAQEGIQYQAKDVTTDPQAMEELREKVGRFMTPTIVIGEEVLIGFGMSLARILELLGLASDCRDGNGAEGREP